MAVDDSYTKSLLHFEGADTSTTITDESADKTWTPVGTAQIDTGFYKIQDSSLLLDGNSDYIYANHNDFKAGLWDLTIDMWIRTTSIAVEQCLFDLLILGGDGTRMNAVNLLLQTSGKLNMWSGGGYKTASAGTIAINNWIHVALTRISGVFKYFISGTLDANTNTFTVDIQSGGAVIGRYADAADGWFSGNIDEVRYSREIARWNANFTPSVIPYGYYAYRHAVTRGRHRYCGNVDSRIQ
jgi:hypothetical protein